MQGKAACLWQGKQRGIWQKSLVLIIGVHAGVGQGCWTEKGPSREAGGIEGDKMKPRQNPPLENMETGITGRSWTACTYFIQESVNTDSKAGVPGSW